jgi:putative nucleotidyltransferase with HDIG domain
MKIVIVSRVAVLLGLILVISYFFPKKTTFQYDFSLGNLWNYDDLAAPLDFPLLKTDSEIAEEIEEIEENFIPYFTVLSDVEREVKFNFEETFNQQISTKSNLQDFPDLLANPQVYYNYGIQYLNEIYEIGVVHLDSLSIQRPFSLYLMRGNTLQQRVSEEFLDYTEAKIQLFESLPESNLKNPDFLYPILNEIIVPNIQYNRKLSDDIKNELVNDILPTRGMVEVGTLLIRKGTVVNEESFRKLNSLKIFYDSEFDSEKTSLWNYIGHLVLVFTLLGVFIVYLYKVNQKYFTLLKNFLFIVSWFPIYVYLNFTVDQFEFLSPYLIPFAIVPIVIKSFFPSRLAFFTHVTNVLLIASISSYNFQFIFTEVLVGAVVILSFKDTRSWNNFFNSILFVLLTYIISLIAINLIVKGDIQELDFIFVKWIGINSFLTLLAYPLIPMIERLFGFLSSLTLVELSDMNHPLLQQLSNQAPGTMQHSLQVANLAESAARKIGASHLLVKVGALYHDIGKCLQPKFFIENQNGENPHQSIAADESAKIIINHVLQGLEMGKKAGLPEEICDFITTHHGTSIVSYFYNKSIKDGVKPDIETYQYPGPTPQTKEQSILMLADTIEAAARSLKNPDQNQIDSLVEDLTKKKIEDNQLNHSDLTIQELHQCKTVFKQLLKSIYHPRIEYPKEIQN